MLIIKNFELLLLSILLIISFFYRVTIVDSSKLNCNYVLNDGFYYPPGICVGTSANGINTSYIFRCSSSVNSVYYEEYNNFNCYGNATQQSIINSGNSSYEFVCNGVDCSMMYNYIVYDQENNCSNTQSIEQNAFVSGLCYYYNGDGWVYSCHKNYFTEYSYSTDTTCTDLVLEYVQPSNTCVITSGYSASVYQIVKCGQPGYTGDYGKGSQQYPSSIFLILTSINLFYFISMF